MHIFICNELYSAQIQPFDFHQVRVVLFLLWFQKFIENWNDVIERTNIWQLHADVYKDDMTLSLDNYKTYWI